MWEFATSSISLVIEQLSLILGVNEAVGIILFTLLVRVLLLPISVPALIQTTQNKAKLVALKPAAEILSKKYKDKPSELAKQTMSLYKKNNITFMDKLGITNILTQGVTGIAVFQALQSMMFKSKFMWIEALGKPDVLLAVFVGILTYISMLLMPGTAEQANQLMFLIPAVLSVLVLISFPSAIALYMAVSAIISALQSLCVSMFMQKRKLAL